MLVAGTINRSDILALFDGSWQAVDLVFVEYYYNWQLPITPSIYLPFGKLIFWHQFIHASALLAAIKPQKLVLLSTTGLNLVVLKLTAQALGIPTYHLEHGFRMNQTLQEAKMRSQPQQRRASLHSRWLSVRNYAFYFLSLIKLSKPLREPLWDLTLSYFKQGATLAWSREFAALRRPDAYIAFSPHIFRFHVAQDRLTEAPQIPVTYIGIPQFDYLAGLPKKEIDPQKLLLIDNQFHNGRLLGWTLAYRMEYTRSFAELIRKLGLKLYVKEHPGDLSQSWASYEDCVEVIDNQKLEEVIPEIRTIMGNFSTLLLPLIALQHTVLITLEIHPGQETKPTDEYISREFEEAGIAHSVFNFAELEADLRHTDALHASQVPHKAKFIEDFLYRMDGKAGERLKEILLNG